jgi:hypothetical protein
MIRSLGAIKTNNQRSVQLQPRAVHDGLRRDSPIPIRRRRMPQVVQPAHGIRQETY